VTGAIGDDVDAVCRGYHDVPVVSIPTDGFLGGGFQDGHVQALITLSSLAESREKTFSVNIVGEKTLEFDRDENFNEVQRLLSTVGIPICTRFICRSSREDIFRFPRGSCNILRDSSMRELGNYFKEKFGTPFISSFPLGLRGTIHFLYELGAVFSLDVSDAVAAEEARQERMLLDFYDLAGKKIQFLDSSGNPIDLDLCSEIAESLGMDVHPAGQPLTVPDPFPVGTEGIRRLLHRWRRACRA